MCDTPWLWIWTVVGPDPGCFGDRHIFQEGSGPTGAPLGNARCECGKVTWDEAVQAAWKRYTAKNRSQEEPR